MSTTRIAHARCTAVAAALTLAIAASACGGDDPVMPEPPAGPIDVAINFVATVNGAPFVCGTRYTGVGMGSSTIELTDFRFYVHDVQLVTASGQAVPVTLEQDGQWQHDNLALLDFENAAGACGNGTPATNTSVRGQVPAGDYAGLRFRVGVPFALNHQDASTAPAPLDITRLFWNWNAGYKFLRIDLRRPDAPEGEAQGWNVHLGSTGCTPTGDRTAPATSCANEYRPEIELTGFNHGVNTVVADYGRLLAGTDLTVNTPGTASGCQSFPGDADCPPVMNRFGLDYEGVASTGQTFFSAN